MNRNVLNANDAVIPTYLQRVFLRMLAQKNIGTDRLFDGLAIEPEKFIEDNYRISFQEHRLIVQNAINLTGNQDLGWEFGYHLKITTLGMLGNAVMSSENVITAIHTLTELIQIRAPSYDLSLHLPDGKTKLAFVQVDETFNFGDVRYFMHSALISSFYHIFRFLTQSPSLIERVELACEAPDNLQTLQDSLSYPVSFNAARTRVYLDTDSINQALITADPDSEKSAKKACQQMLDLIQNQTGIVRGVNNLILEKKYHYPSLAEAASALNISPRTLRRELQKSNTTYQQLLDSFRSGMAKDMLINTKMTTLEIAIVLGYNDASNFNRAFKKWTGKKPNSFRK